MRDGRIEQVGTPRDVYQFPHSRFVADFVGRSNILEARIGTDGASVETALGTLPCGHTHNLPPDAEVAVSVRPDSFELDDSGPLEGVVTGATYAGTSIDVTVESRGLSGETISLLVHAHPERILTVGDRLRFRVLPDFVAVIDETGDESPHEVTAQSPSARIERSAHRAGPSPDGTEASCCLSTPTPSPRP
jgi:iron(III) transport system ATP-binding protein